MYYWLRRGNPQLSKEMFFADSPRLFRSYRQQLMAHGAKPGEQLEAQWRALLMQPLQPAKKPASGT